MRLTRGCRAGGGVACSSLEYGGIRAATRRTPAPHDRLLLPTSLPPPISSSSSISIPPPILSLSSPAIFSPRNIGAVLLLPPAAFLVSSTDSAPTTATTTMTTMFPFLSKGYCQLAVRLAMRQRRRTEEKRQEQKIEVGRREIVFTRPG